MDCWNRNKVIKRWTLALVAAPLLLSGCARLRPKPKETYVYVTAKQTVLRDRVAAVSNRTGVANNGEKLVVLERARKFVKVRTPRGEVGWVEDKPTVIADQQTSEEFLQLGDRHKDDPVVGAATTRDEVVLHIMPGRKTASFYRLPEGAQLSLLQRATVPKPGAVVAPVAPAKSETQIPSGNDNQNTGPAEPVMEDFWLVRDAQGQTGWILSHMIDVTEPDALARYAEGQRIVGAYVLAYADDPESGVLDNGNVVAKIPEYLTVLSPYKAGLPYDFDQVRVFTWNTKKHRYETAFREHNVAGYLPVELGLKSDPYGKAANAQEKLPSFTYRVLSAESPIPAPDPVSGLIQPGKMIAKTYRLEGNICRRLLAPGTQAPAEAHPEPEPEKKGKAKGKK